MNHFFHHIWILLQMAVTWSLACAILCGWLGVCAYCVLKQLGYTRRPHPQDWKYSPHNPALKEAIRREPRPTRKAKL